jgi:hypothetical protein
MFVSSTTRVAGSVVPVVAVAVGVLVEVGVRVAVEVGVRVAVEVGVRVGVRVAVDVGVRVGVRVTVRVALARGAGRRTSSFSAALASGSTNSRPTTAASTRLQQITLKIAALTRLAPQSPPTARRLRIEQRRFAATLQC